MTTLLLSSRNSGDNQALWRAATGRGWTVVRARGLNVPEISDSEIVIYVEAIFGTDIAAQLRRTLREPSENWLATLPRDLTGRSIELWTLDQARTLSDRRFIKPPNDKSFPADVYTTGAELPAEYDGLMSVLVAEPVEWETEFRCFCLDGAVRTVSPYIRRGILAEESDYQATEEELTEATSFCGRVLDLQPNLPRSIVLDVGQITGWGWAVVEANGAWGSGIYGCDPEAALDVIRHATIQQAPK